MLARTAWQALAASRIARLLRFAALRRQAGFGRALSVLRQPARDRLVLTGLIVITAIIGAGGMIIDMQRQASIDAFRTATARISATAWPARQRISSRRSIGRCATSRPR